MGDLQRAGGPSAPELSEAVRFADTDAIRAELAQAVPLYRGISRRAASSAASAARTRFRVVAPGEEVTERRGDRHVLRAGN